LTKAKPEVVVWPPALQDMEEIFGYIQADNPEAARALLREFHEKIAALADHPKMYRTGRVPDTREMGVRTNYVVIYKENPETITVLRVLHTARQYP
jgi:addiction module RelE/StbE family toxin